jgi:hypothetical protein
VKFVTTTEYSQPFPPADRNVLGAGTPEQKIKWLSGLVAESYTVNIVLVKPPPGDDRKSGADLGTYVCKDPPAFLTGLKLVGGPIPPTTAERVLEVAIQTAENTPNGKRVRGMVFLAGELRIDNNAAQKALLLLAKQGSLDYREGRYYLP